MIPIRGPCGIFPHGCVSRVIVKQRGRQLQLCRVRLVNRLTGLSVSHQSVDTKGFATSASEPVNLNINSH